MDISKTYFDLLPIELFSPLFKILWYNFVNKYFNMEEHYKFIRFYMSGRYEPPKTIIGAYMREIIKLLQSAACSPWINNKIDKGYFIKNRFITTRRFNLSSSSKKYDGINAYIDIDDTLSDLMVRNNKISYLKLRINIIKEFNEYYITYCEIHARESTQCGFLTNTKMDHASYRILINKKCRWVNEIKYGIIKNNVKRIREFFLENIINKPVVWNKIIEEVKICINKAYEMIKN